MSSAAVAMHDYTSELVENITTQESPIQYFKPHKTPMIDSVKAALAMALEHQGKLNESALAMQGLSGKKYRYFINNLIEKLQSPRYLEVGTWAGSTFCAAIQGNNVTATAIDNWSQFGGPVNAFYHNVSQHCSLQTRLTIINQDFRRIDYRSIGKFNVYLFDGPHEYQDQYDGLAYALDALDTQFVYIVDDWNWDEVRAGTLNAIIDLGLTVMHATEIRSTTNNCTPEVRDHHSDWHNGYYIAVLRKS
jgi:hypothetical protein